MDGPEASRLFIVCGRVCDAELLQAAFAPFGNVQHVKVIKEKGVAYVKYDRASSAAMAIEALNGAVLNQGRGPKLKVLLAETPSPRGSLMATKMLSPELELSSDPDNMPLRSRLFIVVPKQADPQQIQDDLATFPDLEYCKTDLVGSKGVVFCKFSRASSALRVLEDVAARGSQVAGYKVKCMLAEPKTKRGRQEMPLHDMQQQYMQQLDYGYGLQHMDNTMYPHKMAGGGGGVRGQMMGDPYAMLGGYGQQQQQQLHTVGSMGHLAGMDGLGGQAGYGMAGGLRMGAQHSSSASGSMSQSPHAVSRQRLFVVVHKAVPEEMVARLFRRFPGMEYCDLKKDRATGKSKGYAYVNYSHPDAASAAVEQLNGVEFPHQSSHRIKVMFAEPLGARPPPHSLGSPDSQTSPAVLQMDTPSTAGGSGLVGHPLAAELAAVTDSLASLSLPPSGGGLVMDLMDENALQHRLSPSPGTGDVSRELLFIA